MIRRVTSPFDLISDDFASADRSPRRSGRTSLPADIHFGLNETHRTRQRPADSGRSAEDSGAALRVVAPDLSWRAHGDAPLTGNSLLTT